MAGSRTASEKQGMIYLGSLFVILNKAVRDHGGEREKKKKKNEGSFGDSSNFTTRIKQPLF